MSGSGESLVVRQWMKEAKAMWKHEERVTKEKATRETHFDSKHDPGACVCNGVHELSLFDWCVRVQWCACMYDDVYVLSA